MKLFSNLSNSLFLFVSATLLIVLVIELFIVCCSTDLLPMEEVKQAISRGGEEKHSDSWLRIFYVLVKYTSETTIVLMVVTFIFLLIRWIRALKSSSVSSNPKTYQSQALIEVLIGSLSASAIPTGLSLIACAAYDLDLIQFMSGVEIYIAFAGISIVSIGFLSTLRQDAEIGSTYTISKTDQMPVKKESNEADLDLLNDVIRKDSN